MPTSKKMYVLVRRDLSNSYSLIQGTHAVAQYAIENPELFREWNNTTICFLGVRNLVELRNWYIVLQKKKISSPFFEPDLDNQITALACYDTGEIFKDLNLF